LFILLVSGETSGGGKTNLMPTGTNRGISSKFCYNSLYAYWLPWNSL